MYAHGGLGLPSSFYLGPNLRLHCLQRFCAVVLSENGVVAGNVGEHLVNLCNEINKIKSCLTVNNICLDNNFKLSEYFKRRLYASVHGCGLAWLSDKYKQQNLWLVDGTRFLSGSDFVHLVYIYI